MQRVVKSTLNPEESAACAKLSSWRSAAARSVFVAAVTVCGLSVPPGVVFANDSLGKSWPASQQVSMDQISHSQFDTLLQKYVDDDGFVDYTAWHANRTDRQALKSYLETLSRASMSAAATKNGQLAFWINAYNAVTIEGILQEYPTSSIRSHTARLVGYNIWDDLPLLVGAREISLNQMEHDILRKMGEPRIHFAIVCAAVGCPTLLNRAYTGRQLDEQLTRNATDFFSRSKHLRVDVRANRLQVSSILDWFGEDFGATQAEQLAYLRPYLPEAAQTLAGRSNVSVSYLDYDWSLNDQARRGQ